MKKSSLTIIVVLCCTLSGVCQQVTIQEATNAAVNTMRYYGRNNISNSSIDSVYSMVNQGDTLLYEVHFESGETVLLSGHKACEPVLGYITEGKGETILNRYDNIPDGLRDFVDEYVAYSQHFFDTVSELIHLSDWEALQTYTPWVLGGNSLSPTTPPTTAVFGTTSDNPIEIRTYNLMRMYIDGGNGKNNGFIGVNTNTPRQMFHVRGGNILISRTADTTNKALGSTVCLSQSTKSDIEPYHFGFRYKASKEIIDRETLATMLDAEMFASYSKARNERIVALPLWIVSGVGLSASAYFAFMGLDDCLHPSPVDYENPMMPAAPFLFVASGVLFAATLAPMIPAIILTIDSKKRLNGIASSFNTKGRETISIEFGGINNGIGFAINF